MSIDLHARRTFNHSSKIKSNFDQFKTQDNVWVQNSFERNKPRDQLNSSIMPVSIKKSKVRFQQKRTGSIKFDGDHTIDVQKRRSLVIDNF